MVSARTPSTGGGAQPQGLTILPPTSSRGGNHAAKNSQPNNQKPLSYSQRIETTSTPLQLAQPASKSFRTGNNEPLSLNSKPGTSFVKDGSTDV